MINIFFFIYFCFLFLVHTMELLCNNSSELLVSKVVLSRENPEGLERGIDLADPLNLLKIHLVVFFGYSKYNGLININKEQDYVTKKVNSKNEKL